MNTHNSMIKFPQQEGMTMIELMIGIVIGLIILAGVTNVWLTSIVSSSDTLKQSKLNQELTTLMTVMSNDLTRAGFTSNLNFTSPQTNTFSQVDDTALEVIDNLTDNNQVTYANAATGGSCILFAYDREQDGNVDDDSDVFGFRLNNGAVEMRQNVTAGDRDSCATADGTWTAITDSRIINITTLKFAFNKSECINTREPNDTDEDGDGDNANAEEMDCYNLAPTAGDVTVEARQIDITLAGQLVSDAGVNLSLSKSVRVRNDLVRQF